jgi:hypothetical protein
MKGLTAMRGGAERQLFAGQPKSLDAAAFDERQRLEHLDRRSNEALVRRIAGAGDEALPGVRDRDVNAVHRFHLAAAQDFDAAGPRRHLRIT